MFNIVNGLIRTTCLHVYSYGRWAVSKECEQATDWCGDGTAAAEATAAGMQCKSPSDVISWTSMQRVQWKYEQPATWWVRMHIHAQCNCWNYCWQFAEVVKYCFYMTSSKNCHITQSRLNEIKLCSTNSNFVCA